MLAAVNIDLFALTSGDTFADGTKQHRAAYLYLCKHAHKYIYQNVEPRLEETPSLAGGYEFYEELGGEVAKIIQDNAQTVNESSGEICTVHVDADLDTDNVNQSWIREDLNA